MKKVLLLSEDYVKTNSNISENLWGKFLTPAIREAQEISLQAVIGTELLNAILDKIAKGELTGKYKELVDSFIRPYLLYQVMVDVIPIIGTKLSNLGALNTEDEKSYGVSSAERERLATYYQYRADFYKARLQDYLKANKTDFPEMRNCKCDDIKPELEKSATSPIWLGGKRGK